MPVDDHQGMGLKRLKLVRYFWGTDKSLDAWWEKDKGANPAAVQNPPEPVSSTHNSVSAPSVPSLPQSAAAAIRRTGS